MTVLTTVSNNDEASASILTVSGENGMVCNENIDKSVLVKKLQRGFSCALDIEPSAVMPISVSPTTIIGGSSTAKTILEHPVAHNGPSVEQDDKESENQIKIALPLEWTQSNFCLPDLTVYPSIFKDFLEKELLEITSLMILEQSGKFYTISYFDLYHM